MSEGLITTETEEAKDEALEAPALDAPTDEPSPAADPANMQVGSDDLASHENKLKRMQKILAAQPKVKVRVPKAMGPQTVIINGARFNIPAGIYVEVPEQVADLMRDAEWI